MKRLNDCKVENCIPTPSSCVEWNGGSIEYLGICDGDSLNTLVWELVNKLQEIAGEDLSKFDIDSLADICNVKAPNEVTILSILNLLKSNQICLKDFADNLQEQLNDILKDQGVDVNLKCYSDFDNLGNALAITRATLDQLIIDNLCAQKVRIETVEGKIISLQSQIDNIDVTPQVNELNIATCIDPVVKPTSSQIISVAEELCDLEESLGTPADIASALGQTPSDLNTQYGGLTGWILAPSNLADNYNNLLIEVEWLRQSILDIRATCCALDCKDIELGFSAGYNEDGDGIIIRFSYGAGTVIPAGVTDKGSTGIVTDIDGNSVSFNLTIVNNLEADVSVVGLNTTKPLKVKITAVMGTNTLTCQQCLEGTVNNVGCAYCELTASGEEGSAAVIIYETGADTSYVTIPVVNDSTTTTTTIGS